MFVVLKKDHFGHQAGTRLDIDEPHCKSLLDRASLKPSRAIPTNQQARVSVTVSGLAVCRNASGVPFTDSSVTYAGTSP